MQLQLKSIQHDVGTTFVYVTHDQEEALAMSDRIAVMNGGRVEQIGSPREIYDRPRTAFVADFIGSLNAFDFRIDELVGEHAVMRLGEGERVVAGLGADRRAGETVRVAVRPERVRIAPAATAIHDGGSRVDGTVAEVVFLGMYTQFHVDTSVGRLVSHRMADELGASFGAGSTVALSWDAEQASPLG
jgi:spermidine/putrescine transport system ATP-binding protein